MKTKLTVKQFEMLSDAARTIDHTVRASGFNNAKHSTATAKALLKTDLLEVHPSGRVYRITAAGLAVLNLRDYVITNPNAEERRRLHKAIGRLSFNIGWSAKHQPHLPGAADLNYRLTVDAVRAVRRLKELGGR